MSPEPLEKVITKRILEALRERGGYWTKTHGSPYSSGQLDIVGCYQGRYVALEVKRPSKVKETTERQRRTMKAIQEAGGEAHVVCSEGGALSILDGVRGD